MAEQFELSAFATSLFADSDRQMNATLTFDLAENQAKTTAWIEQGQAIAAPFGEQGVPNLFAETEQD